MKHYPRALNRTLLFLLGLITLVIGAALVALPFWPRLQQEWSKLGENSWQQYQDVANQYQVNDNLSWLHIAWIALAVIAVVLLLVWIFKQGGGKTGEVIALAGKSETGNVRVEDNLVDELLTNALADDRLIAGVKTSAWDVKGEAGVKLKVIAADGASVSDIRAHTAAAIAQVDSLLGRKVPVLVHITSGWTTSAPDRVE